MSRVGRGSDNPTTDDGSLDRKASVCPVCDKFEPQAWRKTMCKNCFHSKNEHGGGKDAAGGKGGGGEEGGKGKGIEGGGGGREDSGIGVRKKGSELDGPTGSHEKKKAGSSTATNCATPASSSAAAFTVAPAKEKESASSTSKVTSALAGKKATSSAGTKNPTTKAYVQDTAVNASANSSTTNSRTTTMTVTSTTTKTASDPKTTTPSSTSTSTTSSKPGTQSDATRGGPSKSSAIAAAAAALATPTSKPGTDTKKQPPTIKLSTSTASAKKLAEKFGGLKSPPVTEPARPGKLNFTPKSPATTKDSPFTTGSSATTSTTKTTTPGLLTTSKSTDDNKSIASEKNLKSDGKDLPKKPDEAVGTTAVGKLPTTEKKTQECGKSTGGDSGSVTEQTNNKSNSIFGSLKKFGGPPSPSTTGTQDLKVTTGRRSLTPSSTATTPSPSANVSTSPLSTSKSPSPTSSASPAGQTSTTSKVAPSSQSTTTTTSKTTSTITVGSPLSSTKSNTTTTAASPLSPTTTTTTKTPIATPTKITTQTTSTTTKAGVAATPAATVKPPKVAVASPEPVSTTYAKSKENGTSGPAKTSDKITPQKPSTTSTSETLKNVTTTTTSIPKTTITTTTKTSPSTDTPKMKLSPSGDKSFGQENDSQPSTATSTPKVKTMVVESSKFQAEAAAAAAATAVAAKVNNSGTLAGYRPEEETSENTAYQRQPSSTRLNEENPSTMAAYAVTTAAEVHANGQNYAAQSYQGSNVTLRGRNPENGAEYNVARTVGEFSRQCSSSSTSSSSSDGKVRQPIVVEVQVRRGGRPTVQAGQQSGRTPSPAPAFMVISPQGNNSLRRSASSGFRTVSGFPSGRTSPVIFGGAGGMYGGGMIDDGGGSERGWDSGGSCYSPSPSSCSSPVSSSMRSVYRPSPSPSPIPGCGPRVIPLPVLHTTSAAMAAAEGGGGSSEYGGSRSASPFTPGFITPTPGYITPTPGYGPPSPGYNTPPPPYSPSVDPAPQSVQWRGANYPLQPLATPYNQGSNAGGIHPNYYNTGTDAPPNAPNVNKNNRAFNYDNSQDIEARDGRPGEQHYQQSVPEPAGYRKIDDSDTRYDSERGYAGKNEDIPHQPQRVNNDAGGDGVSGYQQQRAGEYMRCHSDESAPDISERRAVSRHPSREDNTVYSSADAVVSSGSPAAVSAVAQPPKSVSKDTKEEGSSVKPTRESRDQGPKEQKDEIPDQQPGSKNDRRGSLSSDDSLSPEPEDGLSSKERLNFRIQISELEDQVYRLERKNSKIQKEYGEKQALEKIIGELKNQLRNMERKCSGLEEEKKELEDQIQIEKVKVTKGQLESRSLMELRALLEESDLARMKLTEENELLRDEVNEMKVEIDEMYDQFRESEAEDFREQQKELEITAKNCRILQFKLRKAERRNEQIEADREQYEEKLRTLQNAFENEDARRHIQALEDEVKMAKEVSVRLHDELDILEEKRGRVEEDNRKLQDMLELSDKKNFRMEMQIDKLQDKVSELQGSLAKANSNSDDSPNKKV